MNLFIELELGNTQYKRVDGDCFGLLVFGVEEKQFHAQSDLSYNDSRGASHFDGDGDDDNNEDDDDDDMYALNEDRGC